MSITEGVTEHKAVADKEEVTFNLGVLRELVSIPTASFHEEAVAARLKAYLDEFRLPYTTDSWGNIIAHYRKGAELTRPLALMAHTDHPAFELIASGEGGQWQARLLGGVTLQCFETRVPVKIYRAADTTFSQPVHGAVVSYAAEGPRNVKLTIELADKDDGLQAGDFGVWDLVDFELDDGFIYARVMDDLVGCAAALLTLYRIAEENVETEVYAVFTRAEEVGLVGADLLFADGTLPKSALIVSLEASKAIPGAVQGAGPVIRAGDRTFSFSEEAEFLLKAAATNLGGSTSGREAQTTPIQRQLMTGGNCEGGSALLNGYKTTGLAFPLGNYHNITADYKIAPEFIHEQDYLTGVRLLQEAARLAPHLPELEQEQRAKYLVSDEFRTRLAATAHKFK